MKNLRQKKIFVVLISVLVLCLIAGAITMLVLHQREEVLEEQQNEALQELYDNEGRYDPQSIVLSNTTKPRAENLAEAFGAELRITEDGRFAALTLPEGVTVFDIYENEEYRKYIEYMSLDYQAKISDLLPSDETEEEVSDERLPIRPQYTVSDTDYNRQTYLDYLNMSNVWNKTKGKGITVAVIDTGIDTDHPEFAGRISEYSYNATEDKIVKDYVLADGSYDWSLVEDEQGHGTAVAGVIAASMDGNGVVGIAPQVSIIVIKAECNEYGVFERASDLVFGLYYAIERDVAVVNMSFATTDPANPFAEPAQLAFDSDVICVAAAGNDASAALTYPAADENVFGVGALAEDSWELAAYSNYGENVDFVAPGTVYTTQMGGGYGGMDGTSFASPITAGVLALYLSQNKYQEFNTIEELLYASCYDLGDLGPDFYYGYGALDVSALMLEERGKVTFNMMTDELDNTEQVFIRSHTLQNMPEPERLYAIFDGWYYDPQCTDEYVWYEDEFHGDLTLYANWVNEDDGIPFTYVELEDGTIEIRSYTGHRRYITIPDYIDGKVVSSIGEFAFAGETRLREVKLPKYLKRIRRGAFSGCSNLVSMEIPDTVTEIGEKAFYDNVRLSTLIFGQNSQLVSIGNFAFSGCVKMRTFTVPSKVTALNATAFFRNTAMMAFDVQNGNTAFTAKDGVLFNYTGSTLVCYPAGLQGSYTVPENVKTVGTYAFAYTRLSGVELSNVETLGGSAFEFGSLKSIVIPDSVTSMGGKVFASNTYLRSAKLGAGLTSIPMRAFNSTALTSIEIPSGIRSIDADAFANIGSLAEVAFTPNSTLMYIGAYAFFDSGVKSVEMPASVVTIDEGAFGAEHFCKLISLAFADNSTLHNIGAAAFGNQWLLTSVNLPERLASLGNYAFSGTGLVTVEIPESVTYFGAGAFASCHSLENIFVDDENRNYVDVDGVVYDTAKKVLVAYPAGNTRASYNILEGVKDIGVASFYGSIIQTVYCNENLVTIHESAFQNAWLQNIYFQEGLKHILPYAFYNTPNIERIDLPNSVEILDEYSFCGCGAKQYKLSQNLREIKAYALSKNTHLTSIAIPDSVMQISNFAFAEDWNLRSVTFTENAKLPRISSGAFAYCGLQSFRIPASVSTMAQGAFMGCSNLQSFTFAKNSKLESISAYMFDGCSNLQTITFEKGSALTSIQAHGLEGMRKLTTIDFGDAKITNIDNFAFRFCESLTGFDIPEGVTFLGRYAFYYCTKLSEVTVPTSMDFIGRFAFLGTKDINVYFAAETLPANLAEDWDHGTKGYYLGVTDVVTDGDWKYAKLTSGKIAIIEYTGTATDIDLTVLNLGGDIVNIGGDAFMDSSVERIVLPDTLQTIQAEAFYHSALKSVSIPASVTFIGRSAFAYTPIETLTFAPNAQVKTMEQSAFEKTEKLGSVVIPASVTTMGRAVFKSSGITSLTFADGFSMTEIPEEAFAYTHISTVTIPDSVTLINHNAFREIKELKSVTLGSGAEMMIMSNVFYQSGLVTVYIPENVGYVGEYAFVGLSDLTEFTVSENNPYYKAVDGLLVSKNGRKLIAVPAGRTGSLTVPEGIEVIGFGAFEDSQLSEIKFLDNANILSFGYRAFYNADGITEMHIPASVVAIDYYAFAMCDNLQTVTFAENNNLKGVYEGAFYGCKNLSDIMLPDSVVEISDFAFYGCRKLTDVPVSEATGLKGIYDYAFAYAGFGGDYTTPETLIDIGAYAFMGNNFTSITVPDTNYWDLVIGMGAFEDCRELTEITLPFIGASFEDDEITWIGYIFGAGAYEANATYVPESLKKITISESITFLGEGAFHELTGLEEIDVPHSVQLVYDYAFNRTTAKYELTNEITFVWYEFSRIRYEVTDNHVGRGISKHLQLSDSVTSIGDYAFSGTSSLTSIGIPDSVTSIGELAFLSCSSLNSVYITDITAWMHIDFGLASNPLDYGGSLYLNNELVKELIIPDGVTSIGNSVFSGCSSLTSIVIPDSVTSIGDSAFSECSNLTSIVIPDSVTSIGNFAFRGCSSLTGIEIPDDVMSIGNSAFYGCSSLKSIEIPDGVMSIGNSAFYGCSSLKSIEISGSVTSIGNSAFYGCSSLKSIEIPDGVLSIGDSAFYGCSNLTSAKIPESVTSIGKNAFYDCISLTSITIPPNLKLGVDAFRNTKIVDIYFTGTVDQYYSLNSVSSGYNLYINNELIRDLVLPNGMTSIRDYAFSGCSSLISVTIPDGVTSIGRSAFSGCSSLTSVDFGDNSQLSSIGDSAFSGCSSLMSIEIPANVTSIGDSIYYKAFDGCSSLYVIYNNSTLPLKIGSSAHGGIAQYAKLIVDKNGNKTYKDESSGFEYVDTVEGFRFVKENGKYSLIAYLGKDDTVMLPTNINDSSYEIYRMRGAKNVIIPDGVTSISDYAFCDCDSLTSIEIPDSVTSIGDHAFYGCDSLTSIEIPESVTSIEQYAFYGCSSLTSIEIPGGVTSIGDHAFYDCDSLTSIEIPDGVTSIGDDAFYGCSSLTSIEIPDSVTSIGTSAFAYCNSLTNIVIPEGVTNIKWYVFQGCNSLKSIEIPGSVTIIGHHAFRNCNSLTSVKISKGVTILESGAFQNCSSLTSIAIPDSVTSIGDDAFYGCSSLTSIEIPDSVTSIGSSAFSGCSNLTSIEIPDSVTSIGERAFSNCPNLTLTISENNLNFTAIDGVIYNADVTQMVYVLDSVTVLCIPESVIKVSLNGNTRIQKVTFKEGSALTNINSSMFSGCSSLTSIVFGDNSQLTSIGNYAFSGCSSLTSVDFGDNSQLTSIGGNAFSECSRLASIDFGDNSQIISIDFGAFKGCSSLTSIEIPDGVTSIDVDAFYGCSSLTSINIPDSVTSIGGSAFRGCSSLTSIEIPDGVTSIGGDAFYGCSSLTSINIPDGVTRIGGGAFQGCSNLKNAYITDISAWVHIDFGYNSSPLCYGASLYLDNELVTELIIPDGVTSIGNYAFRSCRSLTSIEIPDSVTSIGIGAFSDCSNLTSINIPDGVTSIAYEAFRSCSSLTSIEIPDGVTSIDDYAFSGCNSLVSIEIPDGVTSIGREAFYGCNSLTSIKIPESVTSVGKEAFRSCNHLYLIYNYSGLELEIGSPVNGVKIEKLIIDKYGNKTYTDETSGFEYIDTVDGFRFMKEHGTYSLIAYLGKDDTITLPTDINGNVYEIQELRGVRNVIIPDSMTSIGNSAFYGCSSLTSIVIPDSVTSIGDYAFSGCSSLTSIKIPDSVTSIGDYAFSGCSSLTSIEIPDSVTRIGGDGTAYYNDSDNWESGTLYIGNHLIKVPKETSYMDIREGTVCIAKGAYDGRYHDYFLLKNALVGADNIGELSHATNLETLVITELISIRNYFAYSDKTIPLTLKSIVLGKDVQMYANAFNSITGVTIYVEANENDVRWNENFPDWHNGNKVVYGDGWITTNFYDQNGNLMSSEIYLTFQVIRQPYLELAEGLEESQVLVGWDINGDGKADTVPATSTVDIEAYPVVETRPTEYTVRFFDADGVMLISKVILPYGAVIVPPSIEEKQGYTMNGWIGYTEGMTVNGNHTFVLDRVHNGGDHDYGEPVWVAPTCTEGGYNKHICKICGEWYATDHVEPLGHDYAVTEKPATCTEEGEITRTCRNCGDSHTERIQPKGHSYHGILQKEATCTKQGEMLYTCENCGHRIIEKTPMAAHDYQKKTASKWWLQIMIEKIMNIFFGYEGDDVFYYECTKCKRIQTAEESKTGNGVAGVQSAGCAHQLGEWVEYIAPTCEGDGVDARFCSLCEKAVEFRRGENALGHDYTSIVTAPTCTEKGYTTHTCHCGDTYVDSYVEALGHDTVQHSAKDATCTEIGWSAYDTCNRCDYTSYVEIPAKGHDHKTVVTTPTCTEKGYTTHTCHCGDTYVDSYVNALGHAKVQHSAKAPTCTEIGWKAYETCSRCDYTTYEEIPAKGHDHQAVVTAPTCTEKGYTTHTCHCGDTYVDSYVDALGHDAVQHSAKDATCTEIGWPAYDTCSRCDYTTYEEIPAKGHTTSDWVIDTEPAPGVEGSRHKECMECGEILETGVIEALPVETDTETEAPTEAPTASNPNGSDTDPSGKGCSGVVLASSVGVILLAALCSVIAVRRREDEDC